MPTVVNRKIYLKYGESISSPIVSLEALFTTIFIDAYEGYDFGIFGVPGAYLHAKFPKYKHLVLKLRGNCVDIVCNVNT